MGDAHTAALSTSHADLITCLSFSPSAPSLLASTSLDGWIRVHARTSSSEAAGKSTSNANGHRQQSTEDVNESSADWTEVGACKANDGPVWRAVWGPREYGTSLLVSIAGSVIHIWETQVQSDSPGKLNIVQRASLVEARGSLRDVAFAPAEFGLKLASIAADSHLRVYECLDSSSSGLSTWSLLEDIELAGLPSSGAFSSGSQGSHITSSQESKRSEEAGISRQSSQPALSTSAGGQAGAFKPTSNRTIGRIESSGAWSLAYCQDAWWGECIAVSSGSDGLVRLLHVSGGTHWSQLLVLASSNPARSSPVSTLAWAPSCGRSYQLLASGSRDGIVRIWKVTPPNDTGAPWTSTLAAEITDHVDGSSGGIGRVEWNITGTILSTAGCDGVVRLWKASYSGEWRCLSNISVEGDDETQGRQA